MQRPTKEEIRELPMYVGLALSQIIIVECTRDAAQALAVLASEASLGFDTESKPTFRKGEMNAGPTLIQLATPTHAFLFPTRFPCAVAAAKVLLSDAKIKKIGFGLKGDKKALRKKFAIEIANTQDLAVDLRILIDEKGDIGARAAVAMMLELRLSKGAQKSNWAAYPLKNHQVEYAANDAHAAICVANCLEEYQKRQ
ncbi:MAG: ribonuclease D [Oceanospirillaceae bacterium]|jgi:ribonuclease D